MAPYGAIVQSPDHIADYVTGELREVDASVRYKVGTSPVLITIECRKHSTVQDARWIEQLIEKKRSIGASITLAVSASGFSKPAIEKARVSGIEIRTLTDATADEFLQWLRVQYAQVEEQDREFVNLHLDLYDAPKGAALSAKTQKVFAEQKSLAQIFIRNNDGSRFHVENILIEWQKRNGSLFPVDLPSDGVGVRKRFTQSFGRGLLHVETDQGNCDIHVISIDLILSRRISQVPISHMTQYSGAELPLVQTAEWNLPVGNLSFHRDLVTGETKVMMSPNAHQTSGGNDSKSGASLTSSEVVVLLSCDKT